MKIEDWVEQIRVSCKHTSDYQLIYFLKKIEKQGYDTAIKDAIKIAEGYQIEDKHPHAYYINGTAMRIAAALDDLLKP